MLGIEEDYSNLVKTCLEILKNTKSKVFEFDIDKDRELIYKTFLYDNIDIHNINREYWVDLMKKTDIGHLSFLLNSKATLKSIYNEGDETKKKELLLIFVNLTKKIHTSEKFTNLKNKLTENIKTKDEVENIVIEIVSDIKKYKNPEYLANLIDVWSTNEEFRNYILKQIKKKTTDINNEFVIGSSILSIEDKNILTDKLKDLNLEDILNSDDYLEIFRNCADFLMRINITGEIKVSKELHLVVSNYVINLFRESNFLTKLLQLIDSEYKLFENDKSYIVRQSTSTITYVKSAKKKMDISSDGFNGIFDDYDKKIIYQSKELKKRIVHLISKLVEVLQTSFTKESFSDFDRETEIRKIFKDNIDEKLLDEITFTNIVDVIINKNINEIIEKEKFKDLLRNVLSRLIAFDESLMNSLDGKIDCLFDFFTDKIIEDKTIVIVKKLCKLLDSKFNLKDIKRMLMNKKKISFKTYS